MLDGAKLTGDVGRCPTYLSVANLLKTPIDSLQMSNLVLQRTRGRAQYFTEALNDEVSLEMVLIPAGSFVMGSSEDELERTKAEGPKHRVSVPSFFMGHYPITQAQWRVVASLEPIERELEANPSKFTGDDRPVERVTWHDAMEFCARLSKLTGEEYRLPSEAEWEYACRAGTTTPFFFGESISADLANYNARTVFGEGAKGEYRQKTTPVGNFYANAFGLSDMHGNVWEWCLDHWHETYEGAPTDGSAWVTGGDEELRILRGGSWYDSPRLCRSDYRYGDDPDIRDDPVGFRVVCVAPFA